MSEWFCPALLLPDEAKVKLSEWAQSVDWPEGTVLKRPSRYHITVLYSPTAHDRSEAFLAAIQPQASFRVWTARVEQLAPGNSLHTRPIGVVLSNALLYNYVEHIVRPLADGIGMEHSTHGSYLPHVTVAEIPPGEFDVWNITPPDITWDTPFEVVDLHAHYDRENDATRR